MGGWVGGASQRERERERERERGMSGSEAVEEGKIMSYSSKRTIIATSIFRSLLPARLARSHTPSLPPRPPNPLARSIYLSLSLCPCLSCSRSLCCSSELLRCCLYCKKRRRRSRPRYDKSRE
jgi:hypothetical protein